MSRKRSVAHGCSEAGDGERAPLMLQILLCHRLAACHPADGKDDGERGSEVDVHPATTRITGPVKAHPIGLIGIRDLQTDVRLETV